MTCRGKRLSLVKRGLSGGSRSDAVKRADTIAMALARRGPWARNTVTAQFVSLIVRLRLFCSMLSIKHTICGNYGCFFSPSVLLVPNRHAGTAPCSPSHSALLSPLHGKQSRAAAPSGRGGGSCGPWLPHRALCECTAGVTPPLGGTRFRDVLT